MIPPARRDYEQEVRRLRALADARLADGADPEDVARALVAWRNARESKYRAYDAPAVVAIIELRNRLKYGDPIGPDADALLLKYGSWSLVIDAACRPARLAGP